MDSKVACYTFVPWLRKGISSEISQTDILGGTSGDNERASVTLDVKVNRTNLAGISDEVTIPKKIELYGPGDIIGIDRRSIVRTEPRENVTNFEPNYLPYIEFYEEDFIWRYTPASANNTRLRPWLALFVLEPDVEFEFDSFNPTTSPLPSITIPNGPADVNLFPREDQYWAWGHVHVNQFLDDVPGGTIGAKVQDVVENNANLACCRLICPRKLKPNTRYVAFVVPAFEKGRLAGLGASTDIIDAADSQQYSWGAPHSQLNNKWPVYYQWTFRTGEQGDFEELVRKLVPRVMDERVGRRLMDLQSPGYGLSYQGNVEAPGAIYLEGALRAPQNDTNNFAAESETEASDFIGKLSDLLNLDQDLRENNIAGNQFSSHPLFTDNTGSPTSIQDDPIITPPIYGKWHILQDRVDKSRTNRWINHLNLDPRQRTSSGFGSNVIRKNQEEYMDRAWSQFGEILEANRKLLLAQFAERFSHNLYNNKIRKIPNAHLLPFTSRIQTRIKTQNKTIAAVVDESTLPNAVASPEFSKLTRLQGPVQSFSEESVDFQNKLIADLGDHSITPAVPYTDIKVEAEFSVDTLNTAINQPVSRTISTGETGPTRRTSAPLTSANLNFFKKETVEEGFKPYAQYFQSGNWKISPEKPALNVNSVSNEIKKGLNPELTIKNRILGRLKIENGQLLAKPEEIKPILAAPEFPDAMYKPLTDISSELLIPNLQLIENNTISVLESNQAFIESYMVGLNYEFGRELLWREFLTDQRGSYFRQFWEVYGNKKEDSVTDADHDEATKDIKPIHTWRKTSRLGKHRPDSNAFSNDEDKIVLVIRGDLLKKYPNTIIYMQEAVWQGDPNNPNKLLPRQLDLEGEIKYPIFEAKVEPDIYFLGFDMVASEARGNDEVNDKPGYFFVLKERTGELHFGMDISSQSDAGSASGDPSWNSLAWEDFGPDVKFIDLSQSPPSPATREGISWNTASSNAADMAYILYQNPFMVAVHASDMIQEGA